MKTKLKLLAFLFILQCIIPAHSHAQTKDWLWMDGIGGNGSEGILTLTTDAPGNVFAGGYFASKSITVGSQTFANPDTSYNSMNSLLVKLDATGKIKWARSNSVYPDNAFPFTNEVTTVKTDASGNVYANGKFTSSGVIFGNDTLKNNADYNTFICKYDSSGKLLWSWSANAKHFKFRNTPFPTLQGVTTTIALDGAGYLYIAGSFSDSCITIGKTTLYCKAYGLSNVFYAKFDKNGNPVWVKSVDPSHSASITSVAIDSRENLYFSGDFSGSLFKVGTISLGNSDSVNTSAFLVKTDSAGTILNAKNIVDGISGSLTTDNSGNVVFTGAYTTSTVTIDTIKLKNGMTYDFFLAKYDSSLNVQWAKTGGTKFGYYDHDFLESVSTDAAGNIYSGGIFDGANIIFDTDTIRNPNGFTKIFFLKYDKNGKLLWVKTPYEADNYNAMIAIDTFGNVYTGGSFSGGTVSFGSLSISDHFSSTSDIFIAKYGDVVVTGEEPVTLMNNGISIYPNPASNILTIQIDENKYSPDNRIVEIYSALGEKVCQWNDLKNTRNTVDISGLRPGIYFVNFKGDNYNFCSKLLINR